MYAAPYRRSGQSQAQTLGVGFSGVALNPRPFRPVEIDLSTRTRIPKWA